ncbi:MAG: hypothetical protein LRY54_02205 [Alphaproteobacteria bacterium]|nr:hypothetical protein [Alphaproteobacteria bacterium]
MNTQTPLKLEFNYVNQPHPAGSDNKTTVKIVPAGDMTAVLPDNFSISVGSGYDLKNTLMAVRGCAVDSVKKYTSKPLSETISFTDERGNQTVLPVPLQPFN